MHLNPDYLGIIITLTGWPKKNEQHRNVSLPYRWKPHQEQHHPSRAYYHLYRGRWEEIFNQITRLMNL